jgi:hypothetical protein
MEIQNYPNYLIYPDGRVWSKPRHHTNGGFIKSDTNGRYHRIKLYKNSKRKNFYVHRLVAIHYIPNPHDYPDVDHIDRDKTNNDVSNLRWVTPLQNQQNMGKYITNTSGIKNVKRMIDGRWLYQKQMNYKTLCKTFTSKPLACWCKFIFELKL